MSTDKNEAMVENSSPPKKKAATKLFTKCWLILAMLIISAGVVSSLFRAMTPWAKQYKTEVEQHLSMLIGEPVTIHTMETGWYWFEPIIKLNQVSIYNGKREVAKLNKLLMGINLFSSLWHWQIQPGVLFIDDLHLNLRQAATGWQIDGIATGQRQEKMILDPAHYTPVLAWILAQQKILIKNLTATIHLQDGTIIPLHDFNLSIANRGGVHKIRGEGQLAQSTVTTFQLLAEMKLNPYDLKQTEGHVFFSVKNLLPRQWQGFIPQLGYQLNRGQGDVQIWADIAKGKIENAQANMQAGNLAWTDKQNNKQQQIQSIKANLAWKSIKEGWELSGDQLQLRLSGTAWPENSFLLRYQNKKGEYFVFIKHLLLDSMLATGVPWPKSMDPILAMKPHGQLENTQLYLNTQQVSYLLTRFDKLGWPLQGKRPGVDNLSGVVHWQPDEGRIEFDSEQASLNLQEGGLINFALFNAAFDWKELSTGCDLVWITWS